MRNAQLRAARDADRVGVPEPAPWTIAAAVVIALAGTAARAQIPAVIVSEFTSGNEGWIHQGAAVFQQQGSGGNPGGFLYVDNSEGPITYVFAPSSFLGNRSAYVGGVLRFDGKMLGTGGSTWNNPEDYGHVRLSGGGFQASADLRIGVPSTTAWETNAMPLVATYWTGVTPPQFAALMANLAEIRISVEALFGAEVQGLDNVRLEPGLPAAGCIVRNGQGINPLAYACVTPPALGTSFHAVIGTTPATIATVLAIGAAPSPGVPSPFGAGELLIALSPFPLVNIGFGAYVFAIPADPSLAGLVIPTQGFRVNDAMQVEALNAVDIRLGL